MASHGVANILFRHAADSETTSIMESKRVWVLNEVSSCQSSSRTMGGGLVLLEHKDARNQHGSAPSQDARAMVAPGSFWVGTRWHDVGWGRAPDQFLAPLQIMSYFAVLGSMINFRCVTMPQWFSHSQDWLEPFQNDIASMRKKSWRDWGGKHLFVAILYVFWSTVHPKGQMPCRVSPGIRSGRTGGCGLTAPRRIHTVSIHL